MNRFVILGFVLVGLLSCQSETLPSSNDAESISGVVDPLPSWNEGETKSAILNFVESVTTKDSPDFIEVKDRIATFDNDGNLWSERPVYFQLYFAIDRVKEMAVDHPEWSNEQPFKAVLEDDMETLLKTGHRGILTLVMATHAGMTAEEFDQIVRNWLVRSKHPRFNQPYNKLVFQPMLELMQYLRRNEFKTFIVSGGGIEFMRAWVEEAYGIPTDQVIGSSIKTEFRIDENGANIHRLPELDFIDDKEGKPIGISKFIGKRPVFASGNSDGDLPMMQYTAAGNGKRFMLYLHHTDSTREWSYDRESAIGRLDKGLDEAEENGWTVIDMKNDWKVVYPFEMWE